MFGGHACNRYATKDVPKGGTFLSPDASAYPTLRAPWGTCAHAATALRHHLLRPCVPPVYGTMVAARTMFVKIAWTALARAATVAVRYSCVRRQFERRDGKRGSGRPEVKVLDYTTQQYSVLPQLAAVYALFFTGACACACACACGRPISSLGGVALTCLHPPARFLLLYSVAADKMISSLRAQFLKDAEAGDFSLLAQLHVLSSGLKSTTTELASAGIERCRRACGGHGCVPLLRCWWDSHLSLGCVAPVCPPATPSSLACVTCTPPVRACRVGCSWYCEGFTAHPSVPRVCSRARVHRRRRQLHAHPADGAQPAQGVGWQGEGWWFDGATSTLLVTGLNLPFPCDACVWWWCLRSQLPAVGHAAYLADAVSCASQAAVGTRGTDLSKPAATLAALQARSAALLLSVQRQLKEAAESGLDAHDAWNSVLVPVAEACASHSMVVVATAFIRGVDDLASTASAPLVSALANVRDLFCTHQVAAAASSLVETGHFKPPQAQAVRRQAVALCGAVRPHAVRLVDAFNLSDGELASSLGRYVASVRVLCRLATYRRGVVGKAGGASLVRVGCPGTTERCMKTC